MCAWRRPEPPRRKVAQDSDPAGGTGAAQTDEAAKRSRADKARASSSIRRGVY